MLGGTTSSTEHGERDKGNLKQLRWIHRNISGGGSPIHGWNENKSLCRRRWTYWPMMAPCQPSSRGTTSPLMPLSPMSLNSLSNCSPSSRPCSLAIRCWKDPLRPNACHDVFTLSWRGLHLQIRQRPRLLQRRLL